MGHLLHMPSHIYTRTGDYDRAIEANLRAVAADRAYSKMNPGDIEQAMYVDHDLESLAVALSTAGRLKQARLAVDTTRPGHGHVAASPRQAGAFSAITLSVLLRFFLWNDVVQLATPPPGDRGLLLYHFGRAVAYSRLSEWPRADAERRAFDREASKVPPMAMYRSNPMQAVLDVFREVLDARFAARRGDTTTGIEAWRRAVVRQDKLTIMSPHRFTTRFGNRLVPRCSVPPAMSRPNAYSRTISPGRREMDDRCSGCGRRSSNWTANRRRTPHTGASARRGLGATSSCLLPRY